MKPSALHCKEENLPITLPTGRTQAGNYSKFVMKPSQWSSLCLSPSLSSFPMLFCYSFGLIKITVLLSSMPYVLEMVSESVICQFLFQTCPAVKEHTPPLPLEKGIEKLILLERHSLWKLPLLNPSQPAPHLPYTSWIQEMG